MKQHARVVTLIAGPHSGTKVVTALPVGAVITVDGVRYTITATPTVHGTVAEWDGRGL
ncbi:hypothetical protein [Kitasatospora indigofera]|uniref:hypothetical protein n=1 Tax=Kitasatospora indigofera TaxID=67307 RepID=UPI00367B03DC